MRRISQDDDDDDDEKGVRAYDQSHTEIAQRFPQFSEQERLQHRRISLANVIDRTASATGISKNFVCKSRKL